MLRATNMIGRLAILIAGIATGVSIMLVLEQRPSIPEAAMATSPPVLETSASPASSNVVMLPIVNEVADEPQINFNSESLTKESAINPSKIPTVYRKMLERAHPPRLSFEQSHALFVQEPRDEAWAYPMETGINDHFATYGAGEGIVIEYVECRSRYCEIGGFAIEGHEAQLGLGNAVQSDWWQASRGFRTKGGTDGRFLAIIPRHERPGR